MCFKYEDLYPGGCWDYLEWGVGERQIGDGCLIHLIEDEYGAEITDSGAFIKEFFTFCEAMHERGVMRPKKEPA